MPRSRTALLPAAVAFFASGAAALVYQVAWQRILALHTGVGIYSVALIVAAFMAGLGIGSHLGGVLSVRQTPARALVTFAGLELAIAAFGAVSVLLYYDLLYLQAGSLYSRPWAAGVLQFASLVPPTALMGMSLPFLVRASVSDAASAGRTIGLLYGINMLGAATGALLAPWLLVRFLGLSGAVRVAAAANLAAGLLVLILARRRPLEAAVAPSPAPAPAGSEPAGRYPLALWLGLYAASGFCALSLEILWFRLLDVSTRSTAFTFGTLLALYLGGSAVGCLAGASRAPWLRRPLHLFLVCQCLLLAYAGVAVAALVRLPETLPLLSGLHQYWRSGGTFRLGGYWDPGLLARLYLLLPVALFGLPTVLMGLSFPALQRAVQDDPVSCGRKVGLLQAANIVGCVAGSLAVGLLGLDRLGSSGSLRLVVLLGLGFALVGLRAYGWRSAFTPLLLAVAAAAAVVPGTESLWLRLHGASSRLALVEEDATSVSTILPFPDGWHVTVNGKHHSVLPFVGVHTRLGAVPAIVHPDPRDVAIIGLGSANTAWAAACRPQTERLIVFEIAGRQRLLLERLAWRERLPQLRSLLADPRLTVRIADGRHALAHGTSRYDLVEADALWPYAAYSGNLYSVEFFRECGGRLKPGGLMCTWAPTARVVASFRAAFPHVLAPRNLSLLIGSHQPIPFATAAWLARARAPEVYGYLGSRSAEDVIRALEKLRPLEAQPQAAASLNRDLFPRDEFLSP